MNSIIINTAIIFIEKNKTWLPANAVKNTFVIQKVLARLIKLEEERMHAYPLGIIGRGKKGNVCERNGL